MGGPYGVLAGLALETGRHGGKILAAAVLFLLPVLVVLMLPSLIFSGLSGTGQPLNSSTAVTEQMDTITAAVDEILLEGIADAEARIGQDFAKTGGDNYEVINPYATDRTKNVNSFIAQYCAAKGDTWDTISLEDMKTVLRLGKGRGPTTPSFPPRPRRGV